MALQPIGLDATITNVPDFTAGINKMNAGVDSFAQNSTKHGQSFAGGFGEIVTGALRQIGTLAVDALFKAGQAVAGFIKDSIGLAGDFEQGMLNFQAVAGKDVDAKGLEQFRDLFIDIGKRLPVSTSEVQQAATEMVKGGIDPAIIAAGGLEQNIQFAAAAMEGDLVKAAEISSKILGGWAGVNATAAEKADFLTHATDLLTKAANASATDVEGLSRGIFQAQGIARTAGVSFDDLTTTLAELAPRFASSAEAGTSLKNMIARLQPTTDPAASAMEGLGLYTEETGSKFYDAQGNFVGFQKASELLKESLVGLTKEQQAQALQIIFGNDAMGSAAALAELGADGYQHMAESLASANGVADAAALKQQGFNTSLDNAKGSVEALQITIGSFLLPVLGDLLDNYIAPAVNTLTDLASAVFGDEDAFNKLSPAMQDVAITIEHLADGFARGVQAAQDIAGEIQALVGTFNQAGGASDQLGGVLDDLNGIFGAALKTVTDVGNGYLSIAQSILPIVAKFWGEHGQQITAFLETAYTKIMTIVKLAIELYDSVVPPILHAIAKEISDHSSEILKVLGGAWDMISGLIDGALTLIVGVITVALDLIHGNWAKAWEDIKAMSARVVLDLQQVIVGFFDIITGVFDSSFADLVRIWTDNWNQLMDIATSIDWANIGSLIIGGIVGGINDSADRLYRTLKNLAGDALQAAKDALGISSPSKEFATIGEFAIQGLIEGIASQIPALTDQIGSISADLVGQMQDIGSRMQDAIAGGFGATANIDRQMAENVKKIGDIQDDFTRKVVSQDLDALQQKAQSLFTDPQTVAAYYKMVSNHEFETLKLRQQIAAASTQEEKDRLNQQLILISRAQDAELDQFYAKQQGQQSPMLDLADQVNKILTSLADLHLTDDQIHIVDQLASMWSAMVAPVQPAPRPAYTGQTTNTSSTTNLNMPIYTNMTSGAIQDSMAIAGAALL